VLQLSQGKPKQHASSPTDLEIVRRVVAANVFGTDPSKMRQPFVQQPRDSRGSGAFKDVLIASVKIS
jgi:hypothetical protein